MINTKDLYYIHKNLHRTDNRAVLIRNEVEFDIESTKPRKREVKIGDRWIEVQDTDTFKLYSY